jgi:hypothetical protein
MSFLDHFLTDFALEKNRRFVIFRVPFYRFWPLLVPIRIYRKTAPTKSTVLGPGPPPWDFYKIYRFLGIFWKNGPSIEPEKPSVKSASTPYPPWKVKFIRIYWKFGDFLIYRDSFPFNSSLLNTTMGFSFSRAA